MTRQLGPAGLSRTLPSLLLASAVASGATPPMAASAGAAPPSLGPQLQVNTYTTGSQREPDVAMGEDGHALVVWLSGPPGGREQRGRLVQGGGGIGPDAPFQEPGEVLWTGPRAAALSDGRFVATWFSSGPNRIRARGFAADGTPLASAFTVSDLPRFTSPETQSDAASLPGGGFVVAWNAGYDWIAARVVDADGTLGEPIIVGTPLNDPDEVDFTFVGPVSAAGAADGSGFVVAWQDTVCAFYVGCWSTLLARGFDEAGMARAAPSPLGTAGVTPRVVPASAGQFVVAWGPGYYGYSLVGAAGARAVSISGEPTSEAGAIAPDALRPLPVSPAVSADGTILVAFAREPAPDTFDVGAVLIRSDDGGAEDFQVSAHPMDSPFYGPAAAATPSGAFLVVWESRGSVGDDDSETSIQMRYLGAAGTVPIFVDGFESDDTDRWDVVSPPP